MSDTLGRDVVIIACAISAGIHGALAPNHFGEGAAPGVAFAGSAVVLAVLAVALTRRADITYVVAAALTFAGLIAAYGLAVTTGLPLVQPEPEPVERLALVTKAVEALGLVAAVDALQTTDREPAGGRKDRGRARTNEVWGRTR